MDGVLYGAVAYVADNGSPRYWGRWSHFLGRAWQRTLNLPSTLYEPLITARQPDALVPHLGRIARIGPATIVATMSAQDPGDGLSGPPLPVYRRGAVRYRVVLRCETLTPHRTGAE